ncbi:MAG TPA: hypothetical protein VH249_22885 [Xanthobacteraceae bacterium]|nr:hypothetical protein [Xanthobacteraceae bacterium]
MPTHMRSLAIMALVGFCIQAHAQDRCPELTRLRGEAAEALKETRTGPASVRCESYSRLSKAQSAMVQYASDHRDSCDISVSSLSELERNHQDAEKARDNVCAGRPARPFPADIIQR